MLPLNPCFRVLLLALSLAFRSSTRWPRAGTAQSASSWPVALRRARLNPLRHALFIRLKPTPRHVIDFQAARLPSFVL